MKFKAAIIVALMLAWAPVQANQLGFGASLREDPTIYLPIRMSQELLVEPLISFNDVSVTSGTTEVTDTQYEIGVGVFSVNPMTGNISLYFGGRVSYLSLEESDPGGTTETDGFSLAPTAGASYAFSKNFSISAEVAWTYTSVDIGDAAESDINNLSTQVIARLFF